MVIAITATISMVSCKPKDADIKAAIEKTISSNPEMAGAVVEVKDGIATLTGELKDAASVSKATDLLKDIKGVKSVTNNLTVTSPPAVAQTVVAADDFLTKSVASAVKDYSGVKASVKDGIVTLNGEVSRMSLPKLMMSLSSLKPKKIENKLTVK